MGHRMDNMAFWGVLVRFLLCCPLLLLTSAAVIQTSNPKNCSSGKGLTFTHVYSMPDSEEAAGQLQKVEGDDQNLVFRHHIRLQTPAADCEKSGLLNELLSRLKSLELEMKVMQEKYVSCCGAEGAAGGLSSLCGEHGKFMKDSGGCRCDDGWQGKDCSQKSCPKDCTRHGICVDGSCQCSKGYTGTDCSKKECPNCGANGRCIDGVCQCSEGYTGLYCRKKKCPLDCGEYGTCIDGSCQCSEGYAGGDCREKKCPLDCGEYGTCIDGSCQCSEGYSGQDCREKKCPLDCGEYGTCIDGSCQCSEGYSGQDCREKKCPLDCGEYGTCIDGSCQCKKGYTGLDCREKKCRLDCGENGKCIDGSCQCSKGYTGRDCKKKKCPLDCGDYGTCIDGSCQCSKGYTGLDCSEKDCPFDCGANGRCVDGLCLCYDGFTGSSCSLEIDSLCSGHGRFLEDSGGCQCDEGWEGTDCSQKSCLFDCGEHGTCIDGSCQCSVGFTGLNCREEDCPVNCGENGRCDGGQCFCEEGFTGSSCSEVMAVQNLRFMGSTTDSLNIAWDQLMDVDYYLIFYYPSKKENLKKQIRVSGSQDSYQLFGLAPGSLYTIQLFQVKNEVSSQPAELEASTDAMSLGDLWVTEETEDSLEVEWENPLTEVDHYKLTYAPQPEGTETEVIVPQSRDPKSMHIITGLRPSTRYEINVRSVTGALEGAASTVVGTTGIDGPKNLVTTAVGEDTASLSWEGSSAEIDRYMLSYSSPDGVTEEMSVDRQKTTTILNGLSPGLEYTFRIWAEKGSQRSKTASVTALTDIDPPKNLQVSDITQSEAVVTWTPPAAQIDGYLLTYQDSDGVSKEIQLDSTNTRFVLNGLRKGLKYTVNLTAFRGDQQSRRASTFFYTVSMVITHPVDCSQVQLGGDKTSGVYTIYPDGPSEKGVSVYCDQSTDGGGWTVFQRRSNGKVDFYQRWRNYVEGFGDASEEYWLGLEWLHKITAAPAQYELRVDLRTEDEEAYAKYTSFSVGSSRDKYKLAISNYTGTAGDALTYHNGWKFTTWDRDNDIALTNCALSHRGAFWYKNCHLANLNGRYGDTTHSQGVNWKPWKGHLISIPFVEMKIRPIVAPGGNV